MFEIPRRSPERPWRLATTPVAQGPHAAPPHARNLVLRMRENRSSPSPAARSAFGTLAAPTFALDHHAKSRPASETLEFSPARTGRAVELPACWLRFAAKEQSPADLRLFLRGRHGAVAVGTCLSLEECRHIAPLIAAALAETRGR